MIASWCTQFSVCVWARPAGSPPNAKLHLETFKAIDTFTIEFLCLGSICWSAFPNWLRAILAILWTLYFLFRAVKVLVCKFQISTKNVYIAPPHSQVQTQCCEVTLQGGRPSPFLCLSQQHFNRVPHSISQGVPLTIQLFHRLTCACASVSLPAPFLNLIAWFCSLHSVFKDHFWDFLVSLDLPPKFAIPTCIRIVHESWSLWPWARPHPQVGQPSTTFPIIQ